MANVFDVYAPTDILVELADDLDEILSSIAYDGKSEDPGWIRKQQKRLKETYQDKIKYMKPDGISPISEAIGNVFYVYAWFTGLVREVDNYESCKEELADKLSKIIEEEAEDALHENLIFPPDAIVII